MCDGICEDTESDCPLKPKGVVCNCQVLETRSWCPGGDTATGNHGERDLVEVTASVRPGERKAAGEASREEGRTRPHRGGPPACLGLCRWAPYPPG